MAKDYCPPDSPQDLYEPRFRTLVGKRPPRDAQDGMKAIAKYIADPMASTKVKPLIATGRIRENSKRLDLPHNLRAIFQTVTTAAGGKRRYWYFFGTHEEYNNVTGTGK